MRFEMAFLIDERVGTPYFWVFFNVAGSGNVISG